MCAGFVDEVRLTPNGHFFDLHSFYKHVEAVRADPGFWNATRRRRYLEATAP